MDKRAPQASTRPPFAGATHQPQLYTFSAAVPGLGLSGVACSHDPYRLCARGLPVAHPRPPVFAALGEALGAISPPAPGGGGDLQCPHTAGSGKRRLARPARGEAAEGIQLCGSWFSSAGRAPGRGCVGVRGVLGAGTWRPARLRVRPDRLVKGSASARSELGTPTSKPLRVRPDRLVKRLLLSALSSPPPPLVPPPVQDEAGAAPCTLACGARACCSPCAGRAGSSELVPSGFPGIPSPL